MKQHKRNSSEDQSKNGNGLNPERNSNNPENGLTPEQFHIMKTLNQHKIETKVTF